MALRTIIQIDEEKCDGCGLCVPGCAEGALQIIDGKAKLVNDIYCDGLGACLGECPLDAITMVEREAEDFSEEAVEEHLAAQKAAGDDSHAGHGGNGGHNEHAGHHHEDSDSLACGCPSTMSQSFDRPEPAQETKVAAVPVRLGGCPGSLSQSFDNPEETKEAATGTGPEAYTEGVPVASRLTNWPVQIMLVPVQAPYLEGANLVIAADCAPFSYGDFHRRFLDGKTLLIGCPKLDDTEVYLQKLTEIFRLNDIASIDVVYMEVPCCSGLVHLVQTAVERSGKQIPATLSRVGIKGDFVEERSMGGAAA